MGIALGDVARAIDAAECRMMREALGREVRLVPVPAGERDTAEDELALGAIADRLKVLVDDPRVHVRHRCADGDRLAGRDALAGDGDGAFGGAVAVDQGTPGGPAIGDVLRQRLATDVEQLEFGQFARRVFAPRGTKQRGGRAEDRDALVAQPADDVRAESRRFLVHHDDGRPRGKRQPRFLDGGVIGGRRTLHDAIVRRETKGLVIGLHEVADAPVLDHHALGAPGGARRVDDVGERRGSEPRGAEGGVGRIVSVERIDDIDDAVGGKARRQAAGTTGSVRQEGHRARVVDGLAQPFVGKREVEAGIRGACFHHADLRRVQVRRRSREHDGDDALARDERRKAAGQRIGLPVELGVRGAMARGAEAARGDVNGDAVRPRAGRTREELVKQPRRCFVAHWWWKVWNCIQ